GARWPGPGRCWLPDEPRPPSTERGVGVAHAAAGVAARASEEGEVPRERSCPGPTRGPGRGEVPPWWRPGRGRGAPTGAPTTRRRRQPSSRSSEADCDGGSCEYGRRGV